MLVIICILLGPLIATNSGAFNQQGKLITFGTHLFQQVVTDILDMYVS